MTVLLVVLGAAVGAPLRYLLDRTVQARHDSAFPWGTFTVNLIGSYLLGALVGGAHATPGPVTALLGTGLCGALTTYSTFSYETLRLLTTRARGLAVLNVLASVAGGLGAAYAGLVTATAIWS
ncbi:fluoride efflux transporter CrcB [Actinocatenispora rupis]|uniref:Fluoride-specific ion channel FluC n=1 Tax=Actinocatenispora rupis TaxID=519421 RepID=A0A8J3JDW7_9ACTN|nr:fluoride efflux transporter CrcB [Actinocatenispora rupis]GID13023.1 putative fluoride ion transporter CrcB 2 [Actinocatenispora rupis]